MVDRLGHRLSAEDRCRRWVGCGPDHQGHWARCACRTPRVGELRFSDPCPKRSFGSQQPELVGLRPEGSLPSDSTDRPAKGPTLQSPRRQSCRDLGQMWHQMTVTTRSSGHFDTKADWLSPSLRPFVRRGCRCASRSPDHAPYLRARRQTTRYMDVNRSHGRPGRRTRNSREVLLSRP